MAWQVGVFLVPLTCHALPCPALLSHGPPALPFPALPFRLVPLYPTQFPSSSALLCPAQPCPAVPCPALNEPGVSSHIAVAAINKLTIKHLDTKVIT